MAQVVARLGMEISFSLASADAAAREKIRDYAEMVRAYVPGDRAPLEDLFELGSELKVGIEVGAEDVLRLIASEPPETDYLVLNIAAGTIESLPQKKILTAKQVGWVGAAYAPLVLDGWVYWNPVSAPERCARFLA